MRCSGFTNKLPVLCIWQNWNILTCCLHTGQLTAPSHLPCLQYVIIQGADEQGTQEMKFCSGYSYGTCTVTCICYSHGSQKISLNFSVIIVDSYPAKLLYLPSQEWSILVSAVSLSLINFVYSLHTKWTTHSWHFEIFPRYYSRLCHAIGKEHKAICIGYSYGIPLVLVKVTTKFKNL